MSGVDDSGNNQFPPPSPPATLSTAASVASVTLGTHSVVQLEAHIRDSKFYYRDGSTVFLVGNKLFKFQASLLAADVEDYELKYIMKDVIDGFEGGADKPGTSDAHPVILPADITTSQFRDLLMVVFGGITNYAFLALLKALQTPSSSSPLLISRLTNIGYLGCRFGIQRVDAWSQLHIRDSLKTFVATHRLPDNWDAQAILRLVRYMQSTVVTDYRYEALYLMRHIISALVKKAYELNNEIPQGKIIDMCAALYKEKDTLINSPGFFGFIFAIIVSLGPRSPIWADCLTREERRVLYVANANLTPLGHAGLEVDWVLNPIRVRQVCSQCSNIFDDSWGGSFSQCGDFKSRLLSEDIRHVVALPEYLMQFWSLSGAASCNCADKMADDIEERMESLYCGLTEKYKLLVETV
ncbi:hypothetical protein B0J17DRAFT_672904 [Rhizoctonia solani]|nr:hypothetical protein B0J17DRAFT_672904 [Rhizoctonia solani]